MMILTGVNALVPVPGPEIVAVQVESMLASVFGSNVDRSL